MLTKPKLSLSLSWLLWIIWTLCVCVLFLAPGEGTVQQLSFLFGNADITDAFGHVVLVFGEAWSLYTVARYYLSIDIALRLAVAVALFMGITLELLQLLIPSRGTALIDIIAAFVGVGLFYYVSPRLRYNIMDKA